MKTRKYREFWVYTDHGIEVVTNQYKDRDLESVEKEYPDCLVEQRNEHGHVDFS